VTELVAPEVQQMPGPAALPRENGELVFDAPWQGRVMALALGVVQRLGLEWDQFRQHLIAAIEADPQRPYYESWTAALEALVVDAQFATRFELARRAAEHTS
jgi:Nitrile hydratase beta subunit